MNTNSTQGINNGYTGNPDPSISDENMYTSYYDYQTGKMDTGETQQKIKTYEHSEHVRNLIPDVRVEDIDRSRCKDEHEYNAKLALVAELQKLRKLLTDPLISDEDALIIYNMLITYVEYKGESRYNDSYGANEDHGLDDLITFLKSPDSINGDWDGDDIIDSKGYREIVTTIEVALKKIKEETNIEFPDKKKNQAMAYFTGQSQLIDYYAKEKEKEDDR